MVQNDPPVGGGEGGGGGRGRGGPAGGGAGKERKEEEVFIYGNYRNYYGNPIYHKVGKDPRLEIFRKEWFAGKDCLDIGCNQGLVTINLAMKFECRSIIGVDIDSGLIETANWNLRRTALTGQLLTEGDKGQKYRSLSETVTFQTLNFLECTHGGHQYDTIIGLSLTKWIHLNWGDDGIITLFVKNWNLLKPGGTFIMEPQPWSSYRKNRLVSEVAEKNLKHICIYPDNFRAVLLDKIGFRSVEVITDRLAGSVTGVDRPIEVYHK